MNLPSYRDSPQLILTPATTPSPDTIAATNVQLAARLLFCLLQFLNMQGFYKEIVLDHYQRPRNRGELENADIEEHLNNPLCGDEVTVYANVWDGQVNELRFTGRGCSISQASASMLTERLEGKGRDEAGAEIEAFLKMMRTEEREELGDLTALKGIIQAPNRIRCATLAWDAFKQGLENHKE